MKKKPNRLVSSTSPYLRQHAFNPVNWYPWGKEALTIALKEDKPILVSIGYSACHWCHVMERESFENEEIARLMNSSFVCIKVDREERPDVDQVYMEAVHAMGQQGGWPLNVFLTPDQKPFYGGTYFPPAGWHKLLVNVSEFFRNNRIKLEKTADQFVQSVSQSELKKYGLADSNGAFQVSMFHEPMTKIIQKFDLNHGGFQRAPKFPMPAIWHFLLRYSTATKNKDVFNHLIFTLKKIARGGIYDQIGGGFARYSTDEKWFAPHFEKMLYDNGQLISLYSEAYSATKDPEFKAVIDQTVHWLEEEMLDSGGGFYSALDADSEGEEGKYYVWTESEINQVLKKNSQLIKDYFNIITDGNWENGNNILFRSTTDEEFATKHDLTVRELNSIVRDAAILLEKHRSKRPHPGLDDKILAGWNGIMLKGLTDAYLSTGTDRYLELAIQNARFIQDNLITGKKVLRVFKTQISGVLEDYAFVIQGFVSLYQATFSMEWLEQARLLMDHAISHFFDDSEFMFFYTSKESDKLIARKKEIFDNVIPASNSQMAENLSVLGILFDNQEWTRMAAGMTKKISRLLTTDIEFLANWASVYLSIASPVAEVVITGPEAADFIKEFGTHFYPFKVMAGADSGSSLLPLLTDKTVLNGRTTIYVCFNKACKLPVHSVDDALKLLPGFEKT